MENKRPTLNDPAEYTLIKQMYFNDNRLINDDLDPLERLERQEAKMRNKKNESR